MSKQGYKYSFELMTFSRDFNASKDTVDCLLATEDGQKVMNDSSNIIREIRWTRRVENLARTSEHCGQQVTSAWISSWFETEPVLKGLRVMKLRKLFNTSLALVCCNSRFVDNMKAMVNYTQPFDQDYRVRFVHACIEDIVKLTLSLHYLSSRTWATHVWYMPLG